MHKFLFESLIRLSALQRESLDKVALASCLQKQASQETSAPDSLLSDVARQLNWPAPQFVNSADVSNARMPMLAYSPDHGWCVLKAFNAAGKLVADCVDEVNKVFVEKILDKFEGYSCFHCSLEPQFTLGRIEFFRIVVDAALKNKGAISQLVLAGIMINVMALMTSVYSMQVYDRVVPTGANSTLLALTVGAFLVLLFDLITKFVRSKLIEHLSDDIDAFLSDLIFSKFLSIRMDQMPQSVGTVASQIKGYESIRGFITSVPAHVLVDLPFAILFGALIFAIGGMIGLIPLSFLLISGLVGFSRLNSIEELTKKSQVTSHVKTGLLVECVEGAETIKSGQGGWRMLSRWNHLAAESRKTDHEMRRVNEHSNYLIYFLQQISYILTVAAGATQVASGGITMGEIVACSILVGRIQTPIAAIPGWLMQWGNTKASIKSLDRLWKLQSDNHGVDHPLILEDIQGSFNFNAVVASYGSNQALMIDALKIQPGEKIAVLGPIGSGKTTLLRLLSGMYRPQSGMISLDGVDIASISKLVLSEKIGFLQQEARLFSGTLRENLILGNIDPGDQILLKMASFTGLKEAVIDHHPQGIELRITEGGQGLSAGQRQLAQLTRVFLKKPKIWLLDEPTSSLDQNMEARVRQALAVAVRPEDTLVLVTHKSDLLALVDRIIVVLNHRVVMSGPKSEILEKLQIKAT